MRIQAEPGWAGRVLQACMVGGAPFTVIFDAQAQADVTPEQAAHLQQFSGLRLRVPEAPGAEGPEPMPVEEAATAGEQATSPTPAASAAPEGPEAPPTRRRKAL